MDEGSVRRILCEILGVGENASDEEIHKGYSEQAKKWHPDRVQHNAELAAIAERKLKEINQAFDCLKSRPEFDKHGAKLARRTQSGLQSQVNPNKSAPTSSSATSTSKKTESSDRASSSGKKAAGADDQTSSASSQGAKRADRDSSTHGEGAKPDPAGNQAKGKDAGTNAPESGNSQKFAEEPQSWHTNFTSSGHGPDILKPAKPVDIPQLRKLGVKIALWMTLIFLILSFVQDKMENHQPHLNGFQPQPGITLSPPDNPASPLPSQPMARPQAPPDDSVAPPPGESYPQSIYGRNESN